jgi:hypothetical protein
MLYTIQTSAMTGDLRKAIDLLKEELGFIDPKYPPGGNLTLLQEELHLILDTTFDRQWGIRVKRRLNRDFDELIARIEGFAKKTCGKKEHILFQAISNIHHRIQELASISTAI